MSQQQLSLFDTLFNSVTTPETLKAPLEVSVEVYPAHETQKKNSDFFRYALAGETQNRRTFNKKQAYADNISVIELLIRLVTENRTASTNEKLILSKYKGLGGLSELLFDSNPEAPCWTNSTREFIPAVEKLTSLLDSLGELTNSDPLQTAKSSILTAFYTPLSLIEKIWAGVQAAGFKGGKILEPSCGSGRFLGMMPEVVKDNSSVTGFELDIVSSLIATHLYPEAKIINGGFEDFALTTSSYDLIISNIPFGDFPVYDPQLNAKGGIWKKSMNKIHNYFLAKAIDVVRPGGLVAFITSSFTLDAEGNEGIRELADYYCDFVGAFRLSSEAFTHEGTSVVTDLIILRKKEEAATPILSEIQTLTTGLKKHYNPDKVEQEVTINDYFVRNPHLVFGKEILAGGMFSADSGYRISGEVNMTKLGEAIRTKCALFPMSEAACELETTILLPKTGRMAINSIQKHEGQYYQVVGKSRNNNLMVLELVTRTPSLKDQPILDAYLKARDLYYTILEMDNNFINATKERTQLKTALDTLTLVCKPARFENMATGRGALNAIFQNEPEFYSVSSLYHEDGTYLPIVFAPLQENETTVSLDNLTPADAIAYSFNKHGVLNLTTIGALLKTKSDEETIQLLGDLVIRTPKKVIERNEYLSGNVVEKLEEATAWAAKNPELYSTNVEELTKVIPAPLLTSQITFQLGASWVPLEIFKEFLDSVFGEGKMQITYLAATDSYDISTDLIGGEFEAITPDGSERRSPDVVVKAAFSKEIPMFYKTIWDGTKEIKIALPELTQAVRDKAEILQGAFESLVNTDVVMGEKLTTLYNKLFNCYVPRKFEGAGLTFPGMTGKQFKPHQKDGSMMIIRNMGGMLDHCVGAGKTLILTCTPIRMRQMGLIKKAVVATLKSVIPDMVKQVKTQYPLARILAPTEKDFQTHNRHRLFAKIANSEWDLIILSHENISLIPFPDDFITEEFNNQLVELESIDVEDKRMARALERKKIKLKNRIAELADKGKGSSRFNWKELGIDFLLIDESQQFKNLAFDTHLTNVSGLGNPKGSRRASNLLMAARYLQRLHDGDRGLVLASGTPISNSLVEVFAILKYLSPSLINKLGFTTIDQFIKSFALITSQLEKNVAGVIKPKTRLTKFVNVTELATFYAMIADIRGNHNLTLPRPDVKNGKPELILIPQSQTQLTITDAIFMASKTKSLTPLADLGITFNGDAEKALGLVLTGLGTKASIDPRMIFPTINMDGGKIQEVVKQFVRIYQESEDIKGTQLIFCDLGTPKKKNEKPGVRLFDELIEAKGEEFINEFSRASELLALNTYEGSRELLVDIFDLSDEEALGLIDSAQEEEQFSVYNEIKRQLVQAGIPESEIAFIHDADNTKKKELLFEAVCRGRVRCCIGSTQKMGTGTNVQTRVVAMHHIDLGWRPSDQEQRNGRGIRQGNMNTEVAIYYYGTEKTIDAYRFGLVAKKQAGIDSFRSGSIGIREMEFEDGESMTMSEFEAAISGDNRILTLEKLKQARQKISNRVSSIGRANSLRASRLGNAQRRFEAAKLQLKEMDEAVEVIKAAIEVKEVKEITKTLDNKEETKTLIIPHFKATVGYDDTVYNTANRKERQDFFMELAEKIKQKYTNLGSIGRIEIKADYNFRNGAEIFLQVDGHEQFAVSLFESLASVTLQNLISGFTRVFNKLSNSEQRIYESLKFNKQDMDQLLATPELVTKPEDVEKIQSLTNEIKALEAELAAEAKANEDSKGESQDMKKAA